MGAEVPTAAQEIPEVVVALNTEVSCIAQQYIDLLEGLKIRDAVGKVLQASAAGNKFLQVCGLARVSIVSLLTATFRMRSAS